MALMTVERLTYRVNELAETLKVNRRTIERRIKDGTLRAFKVVGVTLIDAESVKAMFDKPVVGDDSAGDAAPKKSAPREAQ
jgi:excisionase family DNA binding protein